MLYKCFLCLLGWSSFNDILCLEAVNTVTNMHPCHLGHHLLTNTLADSLAQLRISCFQYGVYSSDSYLFNVRSFDSHFGISRYSDSYSDNWNWDDLNSTHILVCDVHQFISWFVTTFISYLGLWRPQYIFGLWQPLIHILVCDSLQFIFGLWRPSIHILVCDDLQFISWFVTAFHSYLGLWRPSIHILVCDGLQFISWLVTTFNSYLGLWQPSVHILVCDDLQFISWFVTAFNSYLGL